MTDATQNPAARYAQALELEKSAWHALQAQTPGNRDRAQAWAAWSAAISRTNGAWRQLSSQALSQRPPESNSAAPGGDSSPGRAQSPQH